MAEQQSGGQTLMIRLALWVIGTILEFILFIAALIICIPILIGFCLVSLVLWLIGALL
jgi:hypothetical protein